MLALGGILLYSLFRKGSGLKTLKFFPGSISKVTWEGMTPVLVFNLGVQNTSNQDFTINSIAGNVNSNNTYLGNVGSFTPVVIAKNSEQYIPVKFRLQISGVVNNIVDAINTGTFRQNLELRLVANIDNLQLPIEFDLIVG